jgi:uncharacterized sulfatase
VHAYQYRPAVELYDMQKDPLELANIAGQIGTEKHITRLRGKLEVWMKSQGDQGIETELKARERQGAKRRNKKNTLKK